MSEDPAALADVERQLKPLNRLFLDYYRDRLQGRDCLARAEFDPLEVRPLMGRLVIYHRVGPRDFRIRLFGTNVVERLGYDATGRNLLDLIAYASKDAIAEVFNTLLDRRLGHYSVVRDRFTSGREARIQILRLPLFDRDGQPSLVMSCTEELETTGYRAPDDRVELVAEPLESRFFPLAAE
jgi:hypothetical protein